MFIPSQEAFGLKFTLENRTWRVYEDRNTCLYPRSKHKSYQIITKGQPRQSSDSDLVHCEGKTHKNVEAYAEHVFSL